MYKKVNHFSENHFALKIRIFIFLNQNASECIYFCKLRYIHLFFEEIVQRLALCLMSNIIDELKGCGEFHKFLHVPNRCSIKGKGAIKPNRSSFVGILNVTVFYRRYGFLNYRYFSKVTHCMKPVYKLRYVIK